MLTARFEMRLRHEEEQRLDVLAALTQRSRADVVRLLLRAAEPTANGGINLSYATNREALKAAIRDEGVTLDAA